MTLFCALKGAARKSREQMKTRRELNIRNPLAPDMASSRHRKILIAASRHRLLRSSCCSTCSHDLRVTAVVHLEPEALSAQSSPGLPTGFLIASLLDKHCALQSLVLLFGSGLNLTRLFSCRLLT